MSIRVFIPSISVGVCERTSKVIFRTKTAAEREAKRVKRQSRSDRFRHEIHAFGCPFCGHFHIGHQGGRAR